MGGSGGAEAYRAMARQEKERQKRLEERRQQRAEQIGSRLSYDEDGALIESTPESVGEELACPGCHARFDFGQRCPDCAVQLVGVSFLTGTPPPPPEPEEVALSGPRYACEKCGSRGDDAHQCGSCGHWELLDLHRAGDRRFDVVLKEQRRQHRRHLVNGTGVIATFAGLVLLLLGTVYVAPPILIIGLLLTLSGGTLAAGGLISK